MKHLRVLPAGMWALSLYVCLCCSPAAYAQTPAPRLVDAAWLAQHIDDRNLVVLHVDGDAEYKAGHIPGARSIRMNDLAVMSPLVLELPPI